MKYILNLMSIALIANSFSCKKQNLCDTDMCDSKRKTVFKADNWKGTLGYYNNLRKWTVNVHIPNTIDGLRTCIICPDIPDSLKTMGRTVTFSGDIKESCGNITPELRGQEIYFVTPTKLN